MRLRQTELRAPDGALRNAHGYQYDLAGQRTLLGRTNSAVPTWNGYVLAACDPAGQLTHARSYKSDGTPVTSEQWSYGYDAAQNLAKRTNHTTVETFTVNALNQLTAIPDSTPSYDRRGNLVSRTFTSGAWFQWNYTYDHENRLTSVATDTYYTQAYYRFKVEFSHDGQGRLRIKRDYTWDTAYNQWSLAAETRYLYDGLLLVQERNGSNTPLVTYTRGRDLSGSLDGAGGIGGLLARSHGYSGGNWSSHHFYHADGNGNVTALVNSSGALQASYKYDAYGRYLAGSGTLASANLLRFSSKPWVGFYGSSTAGLYAYGYRFYDPYLQRWVNRDPIGENGGMNLYGFTGNRPSDQTDPFGMDWDWGGGIWKPSRGNCWRHACNDPRFGNEKHSPDPPGWNPSLPPGNDPRGEKSCADLLNGIKQSGAGLDVGDDGKCPSGYNKVLVQYADVARSNKRDYHFVRQRPDGAWCEKRGSIAESTLPSEPKPQPLSPYVNCGYLCIKNGWDIDKYLLQ